MSNLNSLLQRFANLHKSFYIVYNTSIKMYGKRKKFIRIIHAHLNIIATTTGKRTLDKDIQVDYF